MKHFNRGQALVEAAFVLPVLLTLILGIFAFGHLIASQMVLVNASREGARLAALGKSPGEIEAAIGNCLTGGGLASNSAQITCTEAGSQVSVQLGYALPLIVPFPGLPDPFNLRAQTVMRSEKH